MRPASHQLLQIPIELLLEARKRFRTEHQLMRGGDGHAMVIY